MDTTLVPENADRISVIELTDAANSIKEIYYADGKGSILSYDPARSALLSIVVFTALSLFLYRRPMNNPGGWIFLFCLSGFIASASLVTFIYRARHYFRWKRRVNTYLKELARHEKQTLQLNAHSFELTNPIESIIERWKNITKVSIFPTHVTLDSDTGSNYIFPAKCMKPAEYETLTKIIREKMNEVLGQALPPLI